MGILISRVLETKQRDIPIRYRYDAFISYSHAADGALAPEIQRRLSRFARAFWQASMPIFRDETGLEMTPHLWPTLQKRIDQSRTFILLASQRAARSEWVAKEVEHWVATRGTNNLLIVLTSGELRWHPVTNDFDWAATDSLPTVLKGHFPVEPKWEDARALVSAGALVGHNPVLEKIAASLYSAITGRPLEDVIGEDLTRKKRARQALTLATLLVTGAVGYGGWSKFESERRISITAMQQSAIAQSRTWHDDGDASAAAAAILDAIEVNPQIANEELHWRMLNAVHAIHESAIQALDAGVTHLAIGRTRAVYATATQRKIQIWDGHQAREATEIALSGSIPSKRDRVLELNHDASRLLVLTDDQRVTIWDLDARRAKQAQSLPLKNKGRSAQFDSSGAYVATLDEAGIVCVWPILQAQTDCLRLHLPEGLPRVTAIVWHPSENKVLGIAADGSLLGWDAASGFHILGPLALGQSSAASEWDLAVASAGDGDTVAAWVDGSEGPAVITAVPGALWSLKEAKIVKRIEIEEGRRIGGAEFSPNGKTLLIRSRDRSRLIDTLTGKTRAHLIGHQSYIRDARFSPDGALIATASYDRSVRLWDAMTGAPQLVLRGHQDRVFRVGFRADGCQLVSTSGDHTSRIWTIVSGTWQRRLSELPCDGRPTTDTTLSRLWIHGANFNSRNNLIATASEDRHARVWDIATAKLLSKLPQQPEPVLATAFSPDDEFLAVGEGKTDGSTARSRVRLYDWRAKQELDSAEVKGRARSVEFSPDGQHLLAATANGEARIWRISAGRRLEEQAVLKHGTNPVTSATWSADGKRVATTATDKHVCVHSFRPDVTDATSPFATTWTTQCKELGWIVYGAAWSHRGEQLAAVDGAANIWVWQNSQLAGEAKLQLLDDRYAVDVAFSTSDKQIILRLNDGSLIIRDLEYGRDVFSLRPHILVTGLAVSPDGEQIATAHRDGSVRIWPVPSDPSMLLTQTRSGLARCLTSAQRRRYGTVGQSTERSLWCHQKWSEERRDGTYKVMPPLP